MLVVGNQHSYSDVCQGHDLRRAPAGLIDIDRAINIARFGGGTTIYEIIKSTWRRPPVVPGTGWATVGGCIANDVHGKNHQRDGTFGHHVTAIHLRKSNGEETIWRRGAKAFKATIGGLGLTGEIVSADIRLVPHNPFSLPWLFPLDYVPWYWRMYKQLNLWQYHCVVPEQAVRPILKVVKDRPLLLVNKRFGERVPAGMLSFCRPGISLSMDFMHRHWLLRRVLDDIVMEHGGAVYPAKTWMSKEVFCQSFPRWKEFRAHIDPAYSSFFSQRIGLTNGSGTELASRRYGQILGQANSDI